MKLSDEGQRRPENHKDRREKRATDRERHGKEGERGWVTPTKRKRYDSWGGLSLSCTQMFCLPSGLFVFCLPNFLDFCDFCLQTLHFTLCTLYILLHTLHIPLYTLHSAHSTIHIPHSSPSQLLHTLYSPNTPPTPHTLQCTDSQFELYKGIHVCIPVYIR